MLAPGDIVLIGDGHGGMMLWRELDANDFSMTVPFNPGHVALVVAFVDGMVAVVANGGFGWCFSGNVKDGVR